MTDEPHERRRGSLKNGNPPGDWTTARRCGATTRRAGSVSMPGDAEPATLPAARREKHRTEDGGRTRAEPPGVMEARGVFARDSRLACPWRRNRKRFRTPEARGKELGLW
jgi:hypothetical protein